MNSQNMSIVSLVLQASWVVQVVMLLLLGVSISSWAAIFRKLGALKKVKALNDEFEREFWSGTSLNDLYASAAQNAKHAGPMERIFASGMRASFQREMDVVESSLSFLGSVASVSPYVGLFGTVWGIMHAFTGFAGMEQVTLATVAPGIAEALVATALGLFAAIPAVIAYNRFARDIDRVANHQETFIEEFSNILQRNLGTHPGSPSGH